MGIVWWLLGRWSLPAMLFLPIPFEIVSGNVHLLYRGRHRGRLPVPPPRGRCRS